MRARISRQAGRHPMPESLRLLFGHRLDRAAVLLPGAKSAADVTHWLESHLLHGLRRQRRAQSARAEEHEALTRAEHVLVVGAFRIDPEFQHPARRVERAGHAAVAL